MKGQNVTSAFQEIVAIILAGVAATVGLAAVGTQPASAAPTPSMSGCVVRSGTWNCNLSADAPTRATPSTRGRIIDVAYRGRIFVPCRVPVRGNTSAFKYRYSLGGGPTKTNYFIATGGTNVEVCYAKAKGSSRVL